MPADSSLTDPTEASSAALTSRTSTSSLRPKADITALETWSPATFVFDNLSCHGQTRLLGVELLWCNLSKLVCGRTEYIAENLKVGRTLTRFDTHAESGCVQQPLQEAYPDDFPDHMFVTCGSARRNDDLLSPSRLGHFVPQLESILRSARFARNLPESALVCHVAAPLLDLIAEDPKYQLMLKTCNM